MLHAQALLNLPSPVNNPQDYVLALLSPSWCWLSYLQSLDESHPFPFGFPEIHPMQSLQVKHHCWTQRTPSTIVSGHHMMLSFRLSRLNRGCEWAMLMPEFLAHERNAWWIAQYAGWKRCQVLVLIPSGRARRGKSKLLLGKSPFHFSADSSLVPFAARLTWRSSCTSYSGSSCQVSIHGLGFQLTDRVKDWCKI